MMGRWGKPAGGGRGLWVFIIAGVTLSALASCGPAPQTPQRSAADIQAAVTSEFQKKNAQFAAAASECDEPARQMGEVMKSGDQQAAYQAASAAVQGCVASFADIDAVQFEDPIPQPARDALNAAVKNCSDAYMAKGAAIKAIADGLAQGDTRPSAIAQVNYDIAAGRAKVEDCRTQYAAALKSGGFLDAKAQSGQAAHKRRRRHAGS